MKVYISLLAILATLLFVSVLVSCNEPGVSSDDVGSEWRKFKDDFGKVYESAAEEQRRLAIYLENRINVARHNHEYELGLQSYQKEINKFADLELNEIPMGLIFQARNRSSQQSVFKQQSKVGATLPSSVDWRDKGAVTAVKDQGKCGSCWAFSSVGALEGAHFLKKNKLVSLSEQQLIDCDTSSNKGCNGGYMDKAFEYIIKNKGINTQSSYPYKATQQSSCKYNKNNIGATMSNYVDVDETEAALKKAVANIGPIAVGIDASANMQSYKSGVLVDNSCSSQKLNHGVTLVGYGTDSKAGDYWIIKNSWGKNWGENGYARIARNRNNMCGIASMASYPVV